LIVAVMHEAEANRAMLSELFSEHAFGIICERDDEGNWHALYSIHEIVPDLLAARRALPPCFALSDECLEALNNAWVLSA
jgi:hypothetical protein